MKSFNVTIGTEKNKPFINIYYDKRRYRFWNGKTIDIELKCEDNPPLLKAAFELKLREGWRPKTKGEKEQFKTPKNVINAMKHSLAEKTSKGCSKRYIKDLNQLIKLWSQFESSNNIKNLSLDSLNEVLLKKFIIRDEWAPKTQLNVKTNLSALIGCFRPGLMNNIKLQKPTSKLHKPINNLKGLLDELKNYNHKLYLCCLLTYGCLLRPHKEVRLLKWSDFTEDLNFIKLSGSRNKSGRNRIVPVPKYIKDQLKKGDSGHNIFSGENAPLNEDYFKTLWSRFKRTSTLLEDRQTLYSFRHTGAIDIFKRTSSLTKLQQAMGHSSLNVSLTYLRGLEVTELSQEDMPRI